jgi:hypothetical protein
MLFCCIFSFDKLARRSHFAVVRAPDLDLSPSQSERLIDNRGFREAECYQAVFSFLYGQAKSHFPVLILKGLAIDGD